MDERQSDQKLKVPSFVQRLLNTAAIRRLSNQQFLFLSAILVALWAGMMTVALKTFVHFLQVGIVGLSHDYPWIYFVAPLCGIFLTVVFIRVFLKKDIERGTAHVLYAIAKKSSRLDPKETYSQAVTTALTVGMGGSAGPESPIVQTGSAIGSTYASILPMSYRDRTLMLACGASAGIAAAFNAPITGVLFALEVLLVDIHISSFIPLLIAGAVGALCSKIVLQESILLSFSLVTQFNWHNVPFYLVLGVISGFVAHYYVKSLIRCQGWMTSRIKSIYGRLLLGGSLLGLMIFIFPPLFGEGYLTIKNLAALTPEKLFEDSILSPFLTDSPWLLMLAVLTLSLIKAYAVGFTIGSGGNGGNFAPALFVGACLGYAFAAFLLLIGMEQVPVSNFCLVGMAGVLTGIFHSPLTAIFLIAEITGGYGLMIPLMIVSALSTASSRYLNPMSLDEMMLHKMQGNVSFDRDSQLLSVLSTRDFIEKDFTALKLGASMRDLVDAVSRSRRNIFPILRGDQELAGIIALEDIRENMFNTQMYDTVTVDQLMRKPVVTASIDEDMAAIMEKFDKSNVWNIPVVQDGKYVGFVSKSRIFSNYRERLKIKE